MTLKHFVLPALALSLLTTDLAHAAVNVRGVKQVTENIYRGSKPNESRLEDLARAGVRTIIDLQGQASKIFITGETERSRADRKQQSEALGMTYINEPTTLKTVDAKEGARLLRVAAAMDNPSLQPVYVHCSVGKDRTGVAVAVYRIVYQSCSFALAKKELLKEGWALTSAIMGEQMSFLQKLERQRRNIPGAMRQSCPL